MFTIKIPVPGAPSLLLPLLLGAALSPGPVSVLFARFATLGVMPNRAVHIPATRLALAAPIIVIIILVVVVLFLNAMIIITTSTTATL